MPLRGTKAIGTRIGARRREGAHEGGSARPFPAIALPPETSQWTAAGNAQSFETIFALLGAGFGRPGNVLSALSPRGNARKGVHAGGLEMLRRVRFRGAGRNAL